MKQFELSGGFNIRIELMKTSQYGTLDELKHFNMPSRLKIFVN